MRTMLDSVCSPWLRRPALLLACGACILGLSLAGCRSGGRSVSGASGGDGAAAQAQDPYAAIGFRPVWKSYAQVATGGTVKHVDLTDEAVLVTDASNLLTYIQTDVGSVRWATDLGDNLARFYGSGLWRGRVWSVGDTELFLLDPKTGEILDRQRLAVLARTRPAIVGDMAVFGTSTGEILGHNIRAGFKGWGFGYNRASSVVVPPVAVGAAVAAVTTRGELFVVDALSGRLVGSNRLYEGMTSAPVADSDTVYCASQDRSIWAFSAYGGEQRWRVRTEAPLTGQAALLADRLFIDIPTEGFACLRTSDGSRVWTAKGVEGDAVGVRAGRLLVWDGSTITMLDLQRGDVIDSVKLPGLKFLKMDSFVDGNLYAATPGGGIEKYEPTR